MKSFFRLPVTKYLMSRQLIGLRRRRGGWFAGIHETDKMIEDN